MTEPNVSEILAYLKEHGPYVSYGWWPKPDPGDPPPFRVWIDEDMREAFAELEIQFQIREAKLRQEKLEEVAKLMAKTSTVNARKK